MAHAPRTGPAHVPARGARMRAPVIQAQKGIMRRRRHRTCAVSFLIWTDVQTQRKTFRQVSDTPARVEGYDAIPSYA